MGFRDAIEGAISGPATQSGPAARFRDPDPIPTAKRQWQETLKQLHGNGSDPAKNAGGDEPAKVIGGFEPAKVIDGPETAKLLEGSKTAKRVS